jgi:hypothetical protein
MVFLYLYDPSGDPGWPVSLASWNAPSLHRIMYRCGCELEWVYLLVVACLLAEQHPRNAGIGTGRYGLELVSQGLERVSQGLEIVSQGLELVSQGLELEKINARVVGQQMHVYIS